MTPKPTMIQNAQIMFLNYVTLLASLDEAALQELLEERQEQCTHEWNVLKDLAFAGQEQSLDATLQATLNGWAIKRGIEMLLQKKQQGMTIEPTSQALINLFLMECDHQYRVLIAEIQLLLQQGKEQRARDWQHMAQRTLEVQQQQNQQWQGVALQWVQNHQQLNNAWFQRDQAVFNQYQQANQQWAHVALNGVQQAQAGIAQNHAFAAQIQQNVAGMLAGTEQRQVHLVQEAVQKAGNQKVLVEGEEASVSWPCRLHLSLARGNHCATNASRIFPLGVLFVAYSQR